MTPTRASTRAAAEKVTNRDERMLIAIGELTSGLKGIHSDIADIKTAMSEDRKDAGESRRRIYEKLQDSESRLTRLEGTVAVMGGVIDKASERVDKLEPAVKKTAAIIRKWTIRGGVVASAVAVVGSFGWWLLRNNLDNISNLLVAVAAALPK